MKKALLLAAVAVLLGGCETAPIKTIQQEIKGLFQQNQGEPDLAAGIRAYEDGNYNEAARRLQSALDQGLGRPDRVRAHKYLAFIYCSSGRERQCRDEFRKALAIDPDLELAPAEVGNPIWGPIFRSEKARGQS